MKLKPALSAALLLLPLASHADSSASLNASATIVAACTVEVKNHVNFGEYSPAQTSTAIGGLAVNCSETVPYYVTLSTGLNPTSSTTARRMSSGVSGGALLDYQLFRDSAMNTNWGSTRADALTSTGTGSAQDLAVYGKLASGQTSRPASYSDTVLVTVTIDAIK